MAVKRECPACGKGNLSARREGEVVEIACNDCGHQWTRDPWSCTKCGGPLAAAREPLLQKARGTQQSIIGYTVVKFCPRCDPDPEAGFKTSAV